MELNIQLFGSRGASSSTNVKTLYKKLEKNGRYLTFSLRPDNISGRIKFYEMNGENYEVYFKSNDKLGDKYKETLDKIRKIK